MAIQRKPLTTITAPAQEPEQEKPLIEPESLQEPVQQKTFRLTKSQARALRKFCADSDMTMQEVIVEGINLVLKSRGLPTI